MSVNHRHPQSHARQLMGNRREALYSGAATRRIEQLAASQLPAHTLMTRAGHSVARLALAIAPHARTIWIACGPGNNGGDGLIAAMYLHRLAQVTGIARHVVVTHACKSEDQLPEDAHQALCAAREAGVVFDDHPPATFDLAVDALFGIGATRPLEGETAAWLAALRGSRQPVLCVDLPSGLHADTGTLAPLPFSRSTHFPGPRYTLSLLTLKPGLFTGAGRDAAGEVWFDDLEAGPITHVPPTAWLSGRSTEGNAVSARPHASHKGSFGDVVVIGGQSIAINGVGMTGAAILAARAALHAGAGRVFVGLLAGANDDNPHWDPTCPELMFRHARVLLESDALSDATVVCGCGGGTAIASVLPRVLSTARCLVLDADGLNSVATDPALQSLLKHRQDSGLVTVLTPHPLEAARLLNVQTREVMEDRWHAAQSITDRFGAICVLKGSGTVITAPDATPLVNASGNARLATAGTGDVLAGMMGSALARPGIPPSEALDSVAEAVFQHGWLADHWDATAAHTLSASRLADLVQPLA